MTRRDTRSMAEPTPTDPVFRFDTWGHLLGRFVRHTAGLWVLLGKLESSLLDERLAAVPIVEPIYVSGLARAGTTIVLEVLAAHRSVATHRYRDYPSVYTPYLWNRYVDRAGPPAAEPTERAQGDGIEVTPDSPEAMEEILWMRFFPDAHDPRLSNVLGPSTDHPTFEAFYRDHLRKLLLVRGGVRYAAKGNYNVTRLEYLHKLFPDARFVIPVRHPRTHVPSLMRQHQRFSAAARSEPRVREHLAAIGHYEFGPDFRPINTGDATRTARIAQLVARDQPLRGWARYWSQVYGYLAERLEASPSLRQATLIVRHEDLCADPRQMIHALLDHCHLERDDTVAEKFATTIRTPAHHRSDLVDQEERILAHETRHTAQRFGYRDTPP